MDEPDNSNAAAPEVEALNPCSSSGWGKPRNYRQVKHWKNPAQEENQKARSFSPAW
jgi:hypothetical protein